MSHAPSPADQPPSAHGQGSGPSGPMVPSGGQGTSTSGKREAFRDLRRRLTDEDLASPGVQKMLLDELERAEAECDALQSYVARFHDADKRAAIQDEKLRTQTAIEVAFGVGVGIGGTILGIAPTLWDKPPAGVLALILGGLLVAGGTAVRVIKR